MSKSTTRRNDPEIDEAYGPYRLVARGIDGQHHGVLWRREAGKPAQRLIEVDAASNEEAKALLESAFYDQRLATLGADAKLDTPSDHTLVQAWLYVWPHLITPQRLMLQAQFNAPNRRRTATQLAQAAAWNTHHPVNQWYGRAGFMFFGEAPRPIKPRDKLGKPVYSFALSTYDEATSEWQMRPEVAAALAAAAVLGT